VLAHNALALACMLALDAAAAAWRSGDDVNASAAAAADADAPPRLARAVSRRMLPTFLAANVMTVRGVRAGRERMHPQRALG
jgi:hypothetical protein